VLSVTLVTGTLPALVAENFALPQADQDRLFSQAAKDYNNNLFSNAQAEFEKVQGSRAQEARQYVDKIKAYNNAMYTANDIMRRDVDELDPKSAESAIQEYDKAIMIKADGPGNPQVKLSSAKHVKDLVVGRIKKTMDGLCKSALDAHGKHRYPEAAGYACHLADQELTYSCGGEEADNLCQKYEADSKNPKPPQQPPSNLPEILIEGKTAYEGNDFKGAGILFAKVSSDPTAKEYLDKMSRYQSYMSQAVQLKKDSKYEDARAAFTSASDIKSNGPGNPRAGALQMELAEGLDQFFSGDYAAAIQHLDDYARGGGEKQPLAHFYLGASKLGRFYVTGSEDASLQRDALTDLKSAKKAGFKAESQDVSPRILQVYRDPAF